MTADTVIELILGLLITLLAGFIATERTRRDRQLSDINGRLSDLTQKVTELNASLKSDFEARLTALENG